jgi:hypothetical protein
MNSIQVKVQTQTQIQSKDQLKTWAQIASTPYVEPVKKTIDIFEQALIEKAIKKQQKLERAKAARRKYILQHKKEQEDRQKNREPTIPTTSIPIIMKEREPTIPTKKQQPSMTPTQMRKWAREQVAKHKAEEDARCFEEITRITQMDDEEREHRIQHLFATK